MGHGLDDYKPAMAMFALQFTYAGVSLSTRAALLQGMSPRVFVLYRQIVATLVISPFAYFSRRKSSRCKLGLRSFSLIFLAALIGVTINQNVFFEGLYLASSSMASAMGNLVPAITCIIATIVGMEKMNIKSMRSNAKIVGTLICVGGAMAITFLRGPKLLNSELLPLRSLFASTGDDTWLLGCLFLFGSSCLWSIWLILQVPASESYPDHLSLSAWMCFFAAIQSSVITLLSEKDPEAWKLHSFLELACCLYSGIVGSGISFFVQAWCISKRGPLFSAMFNPLCTVIVTILAALFLHEEIYSGSLLGAIGVMIGLYVVLWGKAKDLEVVQETANLPNEHQTKQNAGESLGTTRNEIDLEEPLLPPENTF